MKCKVKDEFCGYPKDYKVFVRLLKDIEDCEAYGNSMDGRHREELERLFKDYPDLLKECFVVFPQLVKT